MSDTLSDAQVLLLSALLLAACAAKVLRALRTRSAGTRGPAVMIPLRLRKPAMVALCAVEFILGTGLLVTSGTLAPLRMQVAATTLRLATGLLFLTATAALIELRSHRPEAGCGCFGDLSTAPVSLRAIARCAVLTVAAAASVRAPAISLTAATFNRELRTLPPDRLAGLVVLAAELILVAALSPEMGEMLVRLGYRAPCEMRRIPPERTLGALRSSRTWRRRAHLLISDEPVDMWRERCWRYAAFPGWAGRRKAEVVFAVHLRGWPPRVLAAVVDAATGEVLDPVPGELLPVRARPLVPQPEKVLVSHTEKILVPQKDRVLVPQADKVRSQLRTPPEPVRARPEQFQPSLARTEPVPALAAPRPEPVRSAPASGGPIRALSEAPSVNEPDPALSQRPRAPAAPAKGRAARARPFAVPTNI